MNREISMKLLDIQISEQFASGAKMKIGAYFATSDPFQLVNDDDERVNLRNNSLLVLEVLASKPFQLVSKDELIDRIWPDTVVGDEGLAQCIRDIRKAISDVDKSIIQTVYKRGYRLVPDKSITRPPVVIDYDGAVPFREYPDFRQRTGFTRSTGGAGIAYGISGVGPVVIRAPHWVSHLDWDWKCEICGPWLRALSNRLKHIRFYARGTGRSDRNFDPGGIKEWAEDINAVAIATRQKKFALMGISGGASTIFRYTADNPNKVTCLVMLGGFARGQLVRGVSPEQIKALATLIETGWGTGNDSIRQVITSQLWPNATADQIASFNYLQQISSDGKTAAKLISNIAGVDVTSLLPSITQPVLIVHSRHDFRQPLYEAELMLEKLPNAQLCVLESNNHTPMSHETEFTRMIDVIREFITVNS